MDGIETTQKLRQIFGKALPKVIAMTAYSMQHDRERFLSQGMDDYVPKPIRAQILVQKVRDLMPVVLRKRDRIKENSLSIELENQDLPQISTPKSELDTSFLDMEVVNQLKEMVGLETLISVYEDFEREAEEQILNAKEAFKSKTVKIIQQELHTLKGNSGTIGLPKIHEIVEEIEVPAKTGDLSNFAEKIQILDKEFAIFKENYKKILLN